MTPTETHLFAELERLAAHCPWERVDIWATRDPNGKISFTAYAAGQTEVDISGAWGHGHTPEDAVSDLIKQHPNRDPEAACKAKIAQLQMQIEKLKQRTFDLPPYRPTPQIGAGRDPEPVPPVPGPAPAIEIESTTIENDPPF